MEIRREPIFSSSRRAAVKKSSGSPTLNQKAGAYWQRVDSRSISIAASCNSREPRATSVSRQDVLCHENQTSVWLTKNVTNFSSFTLRSFRPYSGRAPGRRVAAPASGSEIRDAAPRG
ncbi:hypothetical protein KM043_002403 [Ampulex compressa]|nr:hypothetical protein KM043_002403 [Ampulex compressa]